ncbi:hypothetical protein EB001_06735 [bacterium]|nr:hypothetical protein [bacterium]
MANRDREFDARNSAVYSPSANVGTPFGQAGSAPVASVAPSAPARSASKEAEAVSIGYSKEYIASRGGINAQGYFNDVPASQQLTAAEQQQVRLPDGTTDTVAMARILQEKEIKNLVSQGMSLNDATNKVSSQYGQYGVATSGGSTSTSTLSTTPTSGMTAAKIDAIAAISALLSSYGIGDLSGPITEAVQKGYTSDTIQLIMQDPNSKDPLAVAFQTRFSANKARFNAGKPVLSAAEYLAAERSYTQVLQSYGVSSLATKDKLSSFIANDISAAEVADRVGLAIDRVKNADPFTKAALAEYYPSLSQADIVGAVLDPTEGLPALKRKVQIAEIGGAAAVQGLNTGLNATAGMSKDYTNVMTGALGAEALATFGITQEEARKGYQTVAGIAPRAEFLSSISTGEDYTRLQSEQEAFLGLASAKRAREKIVAQEEGRFRGQSGLTKSSLTDTGKGQY